MESQFWSFWSEHGRVSKRPSRIALYYGRDFEVPVQRLAPRLREQGCSVVYPRVHLDPAAEQSRSLRFYEVRDEENDLEWVEYQGAAQNKILLREPKLSLPQILISEITWFLVPGLAFDSQHSRLGFGKGDYDRALAEGSSAQNRITLSLAYQEQLSLDALPLDPWDVRVDQVFWPQPIKR